MSIKWDDFPYQVRSDGGAISNFMTLESALAHNDGQWDKVSWSVGKDSRMILYHDGTWEHRTPDSVVTQAVLERGFKALQDWARGYPTDKPRRRRPLPGD